MAELWDTEAARSIAKQIAAMSGVYCGPAAVAWVAAVWNEQRGVQYDAVARLRDKSLFSDGPRTFAHQGPGFQPALDRMLQRETQGELSLSEQRIFTYAELHRSIATVHMPCLVRIPTASLRHGLHYVSLFKSQRRDDQYRFFWQDNGVFDSDEPMSSGISISVRSAVTFPFFVWGARQVILTHERTS